MPTPRPASSTTWTEQWATAHFTSLYHHTTPQHTKAQQFSLYLNHLQKHYTQFCFHPDFLTNEALLFNCILFIPFYTNSRKPLCEGTYFFSDNSALRLYHTTNCAVPFSYFTIIATSNS